MATLINGNGNLAIYAQQDADWYAALMGGQTVITAVGNQFAYELLASNTIGVKDGVIITSEGRRIQLDANAIDSFDIPTGAQGTTNYYIIGYHLVTGNQSEQTCETFVQLMENGTDTIPEGSFRDGDDEVFVSLYRVEQDDLTIGTISLLLPQLSGSFQSQISELNNDLSNKLTWALLWTNRNPTSNFTEQTVVLDLTGYTEIYVHSRYDNSRNNSCDCFCLNKIGFGCDIPANIGSQRHRYFEIVSNGIHFYHGYSGDNVSDNEGIPLMIYVR